MARSVFRKQIFNLTCETALFVGEVLPQPAAQKPKLSLTRLAVAVGGLTLSLTAGVGAASAEPDIGPAVNTTCTYDQLVAALNAQDPIIAAALNASPEAQSSLRQFLAGSPSQRKQTAQQIVSNPDAKPYLGAIQRTFDTCHNY